MGDVRTLSLLLVSMFLMAIHPNSNGEPSPLLLVEPIPDTLPWYDRGNDVITNARERPMDSSLELLMARTRFPSEDGHVDGVLWLNFPDQQPVPGKLRFRWTDPDGNELSTASLASVPGNRLFFSYAYPDPAMAGEASLEVEWRRSEGEEPERAVAQFRIAEPAPAPTSGRIPITIDNLDGVALPGLPVTAGVPFPRGALNDSDHVRLVDEEGFEIPLQTEILNRWTRFGSIRWLRCSFTVPLQAAGRLLFLEYGPEIHSTPTESPLRVEPAQPWPEIEAGRFSLREDGLWFDPAGDGNSRLALPLSALHGAFVKKAEGARYEMVPDENISIESAGSERVVLKLSGYYLDPNSGHTFCRYETRLTLFRNSPLLHLLHTWIFTGDGNQDRIAEMGWRFDLPSGMRPEGFLTGSERDASWQRGESLVQFRHDQFEVIDHDRVLSSGDHAPGIAAAAGNGLRVVLGVRDFWQNFPSELAADEDALTFFNWPRHGRPAEHSPATVDDAIRLWFIHEGEELDFRLPDEFLSGPIQEEATRGIGYEQHWDEGDPHSANAQGIARTEEMWLYFTPEQESLTMAGQVLLGLQMDTLRAVVDPAWLAASGVFDTIHPRDVEQYPEHERVYEEIALAPGRWIDRVGIYGMWIYGDNLWNPYLDRQSAQLYRAFRKSHHRWPYSWIPYVRSGDPRFLHLARAGTRQMYDSNFCHYVSPEVGGPLETTRPRRRGIWHQSLIPWTGRSRGPVTRNYSNQMDYLWHAYYVDGDPRARDVIEMWTEEVKNEENLSGRGAIPRSARVHTAALHSFVEMYEATGDPWFLVGAHALAERDLENHRTGRLQPHPLRDHWFWRDWRPAQRAYQRLSGDLEWEAFALDYARDRGSEHYAGWAGQGQTEANATGWMITGDEYFAGRLAHQVDWVRQAVYEGEPEFYRGLIRRGVGGPMFTSWYLYEFPLALAVFEEAGGEPLPIPNRFWEQGREVVDADNGLHRQIMPEIVFHKPAGEAVPINLSVWDDGLLSFTLTGPDGWEKEGSWEVKTPDGLGSARPIRDDVDVEIPAEAPAGLYRLQVSLTGESRRPGRLYLPVTPHGIPEVLVREDPEFQGIGFSNEEWAQYWFRVPHQERFFEVEFDVPPTREVRRISIWNNDFERVWDYQEPTFEWESGQKVTARVEVPMSQRGKLWRISMPGHEGAFRILTPVQPVFAISPERWFDPDSR